MFADMFSKLKYSEEKKDDDLPLYAAKWRKTAA